MREKTSLVRLFVNLSRNFFNVIENMTELACVETQIIFKSLSKIGFLLPVLILLAFTSWLGICGIFYLSLTYLGLNAISSLIMVTVLNLILTFFITHLILKLKENISLKSTRKQLMKIVNMKGDLANEHQTASIEA